MTDPYDTHDENNTPDDDDWNGEYENDLDAAWDEYCEWCDAVEAGDEIPF